MRDENGREMNNSKRRRAYKEYKVREARYLIELDCAPGNVKKGKPGLQPQELSQPRNGQAMRPKFDPWKPWRNA